MYIFDLYDFELKYYCQKYSDNFNPSFTNQKRIIIYMFASHCQKYDVQIKDIQSFASEYLFSWLPKLSFYRTFNYRLNLLSETFKILSHRLTSSFNPYYCSKDIFLVDSIITYSSKNRKDIVIIFR
jgi:hypothetical protein